MSLSPSVRQARLGSGAVLLFLALFSLQAYGACVRSASPFAEVPGSQIATARQIRVSDVASLYSVVYRANKEGNLSIELAPGEYRLSRSLVNRGNDVVRRASAETTIVNDLIVGAKKPSLD
ncbi:MAG: hypothetical protein ACI9W2_003304 [Gammaproteobacteria bacterium]